EWSRIGLVSTVQHIQTLDEAKEILVRAGKTVVIGDAGRLEYPGQVIGCDFSNARSIAKEVDAFLFIGGGRFHALGLAISTLKPTIVADPYENRAYPIHEEAKRVLQSRWAAIQEARKAKKFAVLIGLKPGQKRLNTAISIKEKLEALGKEVYLLAVREVTPDVVMNFPAVEAFVNTACPRISLDDSSRFKRPLIAFNEVPVVTGELSWEKLCEAGWFHEGFEKRG
ncbi:diphthamide biosynthesis enzyme Dph2, partial [Candidatus Bathyarchaeota archaeon]|nr:diphthamide biosynthesis enzyme Dph2 [Candidatus Bathyarchaeota archaeon]